jgi:hypothetical protein
MYKSEWREKRERRERRERESGEKKREERERERERERVEEREHLLFPVRIFHVCHCCALFCKLVNVTLVFPGNVNVGLFFLFELLSLVNLV